MRRNGEDDGLVRIGGARVGNAHPREGALCGGGAFVCNEFRHALDLYDARCCIRWVRCWLVACGWVEGDYGMTPSSSGSGAAHRSGDADVRPITRMTDQMLAVLSVLLASDCDKGQYGQAIAAATALRTGTVYPILVRFERAGWVLSQWENRDDPSEPRDSGAPRKYYKLTSEGRERARAAVNARMEALAKAGLSFPPALPPRSVFGQ